MRILFRLFLFFGILLVGIYASTPLWLAPILAQQLPDGWQLEELDAHYPGLRKIRVKTLKLQGVASNSGLSVTLNQLLLPYNAEQLSIDSLIVNIGLDQAANTTTKLEDFSIPVIALPQQLPNITIDRTNIKIQRDSLNLLQLQLDEFTLTADSTGGKRSFSSGIKLIETAAINGRLEGEVSNKLVTAVLNLTSPDKTAPWLQVNFKQQLLENTTTIQAGFDSDQVNPKWLDSMLTKNSELITGLAGKLSIDASFVGEDAQQLEALRLDTQDLTGTTKTSELQINAGVKVSRSGAGLAVTLLREAQILYNNINGEIPGWITNNISELQFLEEDLEAAVVVGFSQASKLLLPAEASSAISFAGDIDIGIVTTNSSIKIPATDFVIEINQQLDPESIIASGFFKLDWKQSTPFIYTSADAQLQADIIELTTQAEIQFAELKLITLEPLDFEVQLKNMQSSILTGEDATNINADMATIGAQISLPLLSTTGKATLLNADIQPMGFSAAKTDLEWSEFELQKPSGRIRTRTTGFAAQLESENWSGFDFDLDYQLVNSSKLSGSGTLMLDVGADIPITFTGNPETANWEIEVKASEIQANKLAEIFALAKIETPPELKFTQGLLFIQGDIQLANEISAKLNISGKDVGLSFLKTKLSGAEFSAELDYKQSLAASSTLSVTSVNLAAGLDLNQFSANIDLNKNGEINFSQLTAKLFSGQLKTNSLQIMAANKVESTLEFTGLDLQQLLAFADFDGLTGTGKLNISLPVNSDDVGITVKNGSFESTAAGSLSYSQAGVPSSNIGLQALENFQYQKLNGSIEYLSDGSYSVTIRLQGSNPDLYNGYPIAFNLTIGGVLPELFSALFISGNFEDAILKQVQSEQVSSDNIQ